MAEKAKEEGAPKAEKQTNCPSCNKVIKKIRIYYRNGKNYCTKRCWSNFVKKEKAPKE